MTARRARAMSGGERFTAPGADAGSCHGLLVLPCAMADGARNMAVDEAMLEIAAGGPTLLRFYGWEPWCLSFGRHQTAPDRLLGRSPEELRPGIDAVRRPTGGRAVFHGPEITYAFACPARAWGGPRAVLQTLHRALAAGLRSLGVPVDEADRGDPGRGDTAETGLADMSPVSAGSCFRDPAPGELTVHGRKLVGSAQCRRRGAVLQHGSILLEDRQELGNLEPAIAPEAGSAAAVARDDSAIGLSELPGPIPEPRVIVARLAEHVARAFGAPATGGAGAAASPAASTPDWSRVRHVATRYEPAHRTADWLWRRERPPPRADALDGPADRS